MPAKRKTAVAATAIASASAAATAPATAADAADAALIKRIQALSDTQIAAVVRAAISQPNFSGSLTLRSLFPAASSTAAATTGGGGDKEPAPVPVPAGGRVARVRREDRKTDRSPIRGAALATAGTATAASASSAVLCTRCEQPYDADSVCRVDHFPTGTGCGHCAAPMNEYMALDPNGGGYRVIARSNPKWKPCLEVERHSTDPSDKMEYQPG